MNQTQIKKDDKKKDGTIQKPVQKKSPDRNMSEIDEHILKRFEIKKETWQRRLWYSMEGNRQKSKDVVAIKKIFDAFRNQTDAQRTFREIIFLQSFRNHPNIVKLHSIHRDREEIAQGSRQPGLGSPDSCRARSRRFSIGPEQERSLPKLRSSRAGFATRSTFQPVFSCNSPSSTTSTTSTTSLAQLREKLTKFTPLNFTKVPARIAATPELPILIEEEYDKLSSSEPKRRCGVLRNIKHYHSDSEVQIVKKTRDLQPIVEERSANLLPALDATASTDQSAIVEAFEQLHNKDPSVNLFDWLEEEALNHEQDKDSGLISDWRKRCRNKSDKTNVSNDIDTHVDLLVEQQQKLIFRELYRILIRQIIRLKY
ncbi:uncharacterized protein LOC134751090 [Cydia strobilella]|uniref:uncharacterized protein LOC134751090 n=1 Tax=Cydia strobilella TaxID=1100964 RepID=UPI003006D195